MNKEKLSSIISKTMMAERERERVKVKGKVDNNGQEGKGTTKPLSGGFKTQSCGYHHQSSQ